VRSAGAPKVSGVAVGETASVLLGRNYRDVGVGVALVNPFGSGTRGSATYAANLGARRWW
jgi:hypothetical protein